MLAILRDEVGLSVLGRHERPQGLLSDSLALSVDLAASVVGFLRLVTLGLVLRGLVCSGVWHDVGDVDVS